MTGAEQTHWDRAIAALREAVESDRRARGQLAARVAVLEVRDDPGAVADCWRPMEAMPHGVWCLLRLNPGASFDYGQPCMIGRRREGEAVSVPNYSRMEWGIFDGWLPIPGVEAPR